MASFVHPEPQPAYRLYPVDRGWRVARYVLENVFARTATEAESWFGRGRDFQSKSAAATEPYIKYWLWCISAGFFVAGGIQYVTALLFSALFLALHAFVLAVWFAGAVVLIAILALGTKAYGRYYRAYHRCTKCYHQMDLPVYLCGKCGTRHTRLWPSIYGVLHHKCSTCGTQLPTLETADRKSMSRRCQNPDCDHELNPMIGSQTNVHIPVVGGPSAGKSNFMVMAVNALREHCSRTGEAAVTIPDPVHAREFEAGFSQLQSGRELAKTVDLLPQAYTVSVTPPRSKGSIVYIYDAAGEAYQSENTVRGQTYFRYAHGVIFIIDPFSIPGLCQELDPRVESLRMVLRPSPLEVMQSYERMLAVLESTVKLVRGRKFDTPLAVVVTKVDALGLEDRIGAAAAAKHLRARPQLQNAENATNALIEEFLNHYGLENFVRDTRLQFRSVRFFSCSALGRMPDGATTTPYVPQRVLAPLQYILRSAGALARES